VVLKSCPAPPDDTNAVHLPSFCFDVKASSSHSLIFALDTSGKLYACSSAERESPEEYQLVASDCTSFTISPSFLVYTTSSHESKYAPLDILRRRVEGEQVSEAAKSWETRRVERGSQIVTVVPSAMALVLQMPRGNLETINPRPLVIEVLKRDILA
jgi:elongator complex protein 1